MVRLDKFDEIIDQVEHNSRPERTLASWLAHEPFREDCLDRRLKRHHITGIAFSGAVGAGLFQSSGEIIALGGPVGALLAYLFAGLVVFSVMRSLAEMASIRPVKGALMDYPHTFVDESLGFAVGITYWSVWISKGHMLETIDTHFRYSLCDKFRLASCMSMVTLTIAATMCTQYWGSGFSVGSATFVLLLGIALMNVCGVRVSDHDITLEIMGANDGQLYGNLEWAFKWFKILLIIGLCLVMIAILVGAGTGTVVRNYKLAPGWNPKGYNQTDPEKYPTHQTDPVIFGIGGKILSVWSCTSLAMFSLMGGETCLVTAGEAESPRKDLPKATRYMYLLPIGFYLISIVLVGLNVNYLDPVFYHPYTTQGYLTAERSPFVIAITHAGIKTLPGFLNACFMFSALTAANSALYVSSRTLFNLAQNSDSPRVKSIKTPGYPSSYTFSAACILDLSFVYMAASA
ncbi:hypothetical protein MMC07_000508 [Pseudocyphellaria aurata]|nr:hypothetical protein [Pseudocyphellaria aurata]